MQEMGPTGEGGGRGARERARSSTGTGMNETELRLNAKYLKKVVADQPDLPGEIAAKLAI